MYGKHTINLRDRCEGAQSSPTKTNTNWHELVQIKQSQGTSLHNGPKKQIYRPGNADKNTA